MPAHRHPSPALLALVTVLALLLTACGGDDDAPDKPGVGSGTQDEPSTSEAAPDPGYGVPELGECHRLTEAQSRASVDASKPVDCDSAHTSVVAYVGYVPVAVTPKTPVPERAALGMRVCEPAYRKVVGGTLADRATSILTWTLFTPGQDQLERGARWVRCDVVARSGSTLVRLPAKPPLLGSGVPEELRVCQTASGTDVSCGQQHAFRVQSVYRAAGNAYPAAPGYTATARARCAQLTGGIGGFWQPPSRGGWASGDRFIRCLAPTGAPTA